MKLDELIEDVTVRLLKLTVTSLPKDVKEAISEAAKSEEGIAKKQLEAILRNVEISERRGLPMCQDTGLITFYVEMGTEFPKIPLKEVLIRATREATREVPLRPNAVDVWSGINSGDNVGEGIPHISWELVEGSKLRLTVVPKGGGSEYPAKLFIFPGRARREDLLSSVLTAITEAGGKPCPPTVVGVGVGGTTDLSMQLAKKAAVLRPIGSRSSHPEARELEDELKRLANELGIGPMGLGGKTTVLDVHIEFAHRHPAFTPVAVVFSCWALRRATAEISQDGTVKYLSHEVSS